MVDTLHEMVKVRFSTPEEVRKYREFVHTGLLAWERTVVQKHLPDPGKLLDIGCGGGREAIALQRLGYCVTGIDLSALEVESAKATAAEQGLDIDFQLCCEDCLDFPDSSFDYAIIWAQVLGNVATRESRIRLLRECLRVVKPTGKLVFSVHNRDACEPIARQKGMIEVDPGVALEDGDFILKGDSDSDTPCYWHYFDKDEITLLCADAGWTILECDLAREFGQADWDTIWVCVAQSISD